MQAFISGKGSVTPQRTFGKNYFFEELHQPEKEYYACIDPGYKNYISPVRLRRMGKIMKMGVSASKMCLDDAGVANPGAILVGTALGCLGDTEKFLTSFLETNEGLLNPTPFIQSTHNAVASQIALMLGCKGYNYTYVNRGFSFESALLDACLLVQEDTDNALAGGVEEMTEGYYVVTKKRSFWKKNIKRLDMNILESATEGSYGGEGACFVLISKSPGPNCYARVGNVKTIFHPQGEPLTKSHFEEFAKSAEISLAEIDAVVLGINGDAQMDKRHYSFPRELFKERCQLYFKHFCGEYYTSGSFALDFSLSLIRNQRIPPLAKMNGIAPGQLNNVLIYNHWGGVYHSLIALSKC